MSINKKSFKEAARLISNITGIGFEEVLDDLRNPPKNLNSDISYPCFKLAKLWNVSPQEAAQILANKLFPGSSGG